MRVALLDGWDDGMTKICWQFAYTLGSYFYECSIVFLRRSDSLFMVRQIFSCKTIPRNYYCPPHSLFQRTGSHNSAVGYSSLIQTTKKECWKWLTTEDIFLTIRGSCSLLYLLHLIAMTVNAFWQKPIHTVVICSDNQTG